jgi:hypothetical protein
LRADGSPLGDRVITIAESLHGGVIVPAGEDGTVIDVDPDNGDLVIRLDRCIAGLEHAANLICVAAKSRAVALCARASFAARWRLRADDAMRRVAEIF